MKSPLLILALILSFSGCSKQILVNPPEGEIVNSVDTETFHAQYNGRPLKVGDRISILKYEDFEKDLNDRRSRTMPLEKKKVSIGSGTVSSVLKDNYYELKPDTPQHIPSEAFIEKL